MPGKITNANTKYAQNLAYLKYLNAELQKVEPNKPIELLLYRRSLLHDYFGNDKQSLEDARRAMHEAEKASSFTSIGAKYFYRLCYIQIKLKYFKDARNTLTKSIRCRNTSKDINYKLKLGHLNNYLNDVKKTERVTDVLKILNYTTDDDSTLCGSVVALRADARHSVCPRRSSRRCHRHWRGWHRPD